MALRKLETCTYAQPFSQIPKPSPLQSAAAAHGRAIKSAADTHTWNKILTAYSNHSGLVDALNLFDEIPSRDAVSWNSLVAAYVSHGAHLQSWRLFKTMTVNGFAFDQFTLGSVLKSAAVAGRVDLGRPLHSLAVKTALDRNVYVGSALVDMYAKCDIIEDARLTFESMPDPNTVSWNAVIAGYSRVGEAGPAFRILGRMEREGLMPDEATFASVLSLVDEPFYYKLMTQLHAKIIKRARVMGTIVYNAAITAYSQCGFVVDCRKVFEGMEDDRDLVTWNSMLSAYAYHGLTEGAVELFTRMQESGFEQDMYTFTSVISACFEHSQRGRGKALHGLAVKRGLEVLTPVSNALIAMYIRAGGDSAAMDDAVKCFNSMESRDAVSWNSVLTGFSQNGLGEEALRFFGRMRADRIKTDHYAFSATLRSCSDLAVCQLGQQVHVLVLRSGFGSNDFVASSLIHMYSKCGVLRDARRSFDESCKESSVTWNSIILGYAQHGQGQTSLRLFYEMQNLEVEPDHVTFVGLLSACSHCGLIEEGSMFLNAMEPIYGVPLRMEHYACGVDLYGRAGKLDEALGLIESMPFEPDSMVWMTLLGACRTHRNIELASHVAKRLLELAPREHSIYVLLSSIYAGFGMWNNSATIQKIMRNRRVNKVPGWSWIETKNKVNSFNAEDRSHPESEEIYGMLSSLMEEIEIGAHVPLPEFEMLEFESACML